MVMSVGLTPNQCPLYPKIGDVMMVKNTNPPLCSLAGVTCVTRLKFIFDFLEEEQTMRKAIIVGLGHYWSKNILLVR